jgi:hypothetical protein
MLADIAAPIFVPILVYFQSITQIENTSFTTFNRFPQRNALCSLLIKIREAFVLDGKGILVNVREREHL